MSENETKKEEEFDTKRARRACSITFLVLILIFVAPILTLYLLILHACHQEPDLSDYHLIGETVVLSGEEIDYRIVYEHYDEKSIKLSITIDEEFETPEFLRFYTGTKNIECIYYNNERYKEELVPFIFPIGEIVLPMETNTCEVEIFYMADKFKGYVKFELTHLPTYYGSLEAFYIKLY